MNLRLRSLRNKAYAENCQFGTRRLWAESMRLCCCRTMMKAMWIEKMKVQFGILSSSIAIGVVTNYLFRDGIAPGAPLGLNMVAFTGLLSGAMVWLTWRYKLPRSRGSLGYLLAALALAAGCAWRSSPFLNGLNVTLIVLTLSLASVSLQGSRFLSSGVCRYFEAAGVALIQTLFSISPWRIFFQEVGWSKMLPQAMRPKVAGVLRGCAFAIPILLIFGCLLSSADPVFAALLTRAFNIDAGRMLPNMIYTALFSWLAIGFFDGAIRGNANPKEASLEELRCPSLGMAECSTILALLNALFAAFVAVQFHYFFGGRSIVALTDGLTFADYARRGFFELAGVTALVLPMLLVLEWCTKRVSRTAKLTFSLLSGVQILLLFVIIGSAVQRMHLYQLEFGLTELRFYTMAYMGWLAVVCLIFLATVLSGKRKYFAFASFLSGLFAVGALHVANPDAIIMSVNLERAREGKSFDVDYAFMLSDDAVPVLALDAPRSLTGECRKRVFKGLLSSRGHAWKRDWRSWNWSRSSAVQSVEAAASTLQTTIK